jgi:hypothetical protein
METTATPADESTPAATAARARIREQLQAAIDRQRPLDDTRRAAALIAESSIRFVDEPGEDGYVIVGRDQQPRTLVRDGKSVAFTLDDLAAEIRQMYPTLFTAEAPEPGRREAPAPARDWLILGSASEAADPARADAPAPDHLSGEAVAAPERAVARMRGALRNARGLATGWAAGAGAAMRARAAARRAQDAPPPDRHAARPPFLRIRNDARWRLAGYAALVLALGAIGIAVIPGPRTKPTPAAVDTAAAPKTAAPPATATTSPAAPAAPGDANGSLSGAPEIVDTATLRIGGAIVRLFGVEWARGAQTDDLNRYLAGRDVTCTPAARPDRHRCQVDGRDLSEVVLYNGGGRATADATPELKAAEDHARAAGWGVWQKN